MILRVHTSYIYQNYRRICATYKTRILIFRMCANKQHQHDIHDPRPLSKQSNRIESNGLINDHKKSRLRSTCRLSMITLTNPDPWSCLASVTSEWACRFSHAKQHRPSGSSTLAQQDMLFYTANQFWLLHQVLFGLGIWFSFGPAPSAHIMIGFMIWGDSQKNQESTLVSWHHQRNEWRNMNMRLDVHDLHLSKNNK